MKLGGGGGGGGNFFFNVFLISYSVCISFFFRNNLNFIKHKLEKNLKGCLSKSEKILTT